MGFDDNDFENQLEKELENYMGRPLTDIGTNVNEEPEDEENDFSEGGKKRKKVKIAVISLLAVLFVALIGVYAGFTYYYSDKFFPGTVINHVDCGELTVQQAEELIRKEVEGYTLEVVFQNEEKQTIQGFDIDYEYVPDGSVQEVKKSQNSFLWIGGILGGGKEYKIDADIKYSTEKLEQVTAQMPQMQEENMIEPADAKVEFVDAKFQVTPEENGSKLDKEQAFKVIEKAISENEEKVSLEEAGVYFRPEKKQDDESLVSQMNQLNEYTSCSITYQLPSGDQVLDGTTLKDWLSVDENGNYSRDETVWNQHIAEYVAAMAQAVNTYNVDAKFKATGLGEITIKGKYGFEINQEAEVAQLTEELANHTVTARKPVYSHEALSYENNGFGNSYVEIDLSRQHVWMYKNGELIVDTGCVSGKMTSDRWTPPGIFTLTFKKSPSVLRGPKQEDGTYEWESPVTYWMPFNGGIGLHDATWRSSSQFGTNVYKNSGSHGCVNLPLSKAKVIYENIDSSMPIICYYSEPYSVSPAPPKPKATPAPTKAPTKEPTKEPADKPAETPPAETPPEEPEEPPTETPDEPSEPEYE